MILILKKTILVLVIGGSAAIAQTPKPTINDLSWLSGCWEANRKGREISEQWMKPSGRMMLGMGRTVTDGKTVEFEFLQIREDGDGAIHYVAKPSGQPEAAFKLIKLQNREVIFENAEHDFPQRIIYRLQPDGSLLARIEGKLQGQIKGIDYPMVRGRCD
jgi:Domain of unknown function (DUF6265)